MSFSISKTAQRYPRLPYENIKDAILGKKYELSLAFTGSTEARKLNKAYRRKTYVPNVLSFHLSKTVGQICITPMVARREAPKYGMTERGYVGYLFIHGLLHLKGHTHGATMEKAEKKYTERFGLK